MPAANVEELQMQDGKQEIRMKASFSGSCRNREKIKPENVLCAERVEPTNARVRQSMITANGYIYSWVRNIKQLVW